MRFCRQPHGLALLDAECFIEIRNVRERADDAPFRRRMNIAQQSAAQQFFAPLVEPSEGVAEEESLHRRQASNRFAAFVFVGLLEGVEAEENAAVIRDVLAEARLSVDV